MAAEKPEYSVRLHIVSPRDNRDVPPVWRVQIGPKYKEGMKKVLQGIWKPNSRCWEVPFIPQWGTVKEICKALDEIIQSVDRPLSQNKQSIIVNHGNGDPTKWHNKWEQPTTSTWNPLAAQAPAASVSISSTSSAGRKDISRPANIDYKKTTVVQSLVDYDNDEGDIVLMSPSHNIVSNECSIYAQFKFEELQRLVPAQVILHVEEKKFARGNVCVAFTGSIAEVQTYYEMRFQNSDVIESETLYYREHKDRNRAARVVVAFLF